MFFPLTLFKCTFCLTACLLSVQPESDHPDTYMISEKWKVKSEISKSDHPDTYIRYILIQTWSGISWYIHDQVRPDIGMAFLTLGSLSIRSHNNCFFIATDAWLTYCFFIATQCVTDVWLTFLIAPHLFDLLALSLDLDCFYLFFIAISTQMFDLLALFLLTFLFDLVFYCTTYLLALSLDLHLTALLKLEARKFRQQLKMVWFDLVFISGYFYQRI